MDVEVNGCCPITVGTCTQMEGWRRTTNEVLDMMQMIRTRFEPTASQTELNYSAYYYVWALGLIKVLHIKAVTK